MTLRVYVAGSSKERERVRAAMDAVRAMGAEVTYDWTQAIEETAARGLTDADLSDVEQLCHAHRDEDAIVRADYVWLLIPAEKSEGAHYELAWAIAHRKRVVASGPRRPLFTSRAFVRTDSDDHARAFLEGAAAVHR